MDNQKLLHRDHQYRNRCPNENHFNSNKVQYSDKLTSSRQSFNIIIYLYCFRLMASLNGDSTTQGCFFSGVTWRPGGILAEKYRGKYIFGFGTLFTAPVFTLVTPIAARSSTTALIVVRVLTPDWFSRG